MAFTASALSFMFQDLAAPIVCVGSQRSSDRPSSDGPLNIMDACQIAGHADLGEVVVSMHGNTDDSYNLIHRGVMARTEVAFGDKPAQQIIELAERSQSAVVAMSTHGRSGVDRFVFGSVAEKVLRAGTVPLLLVRAPGSETPRDADDGASCNVSFKT